MQMFFCRASVPACPTFGRQEYLALQFRHSFPEGKARPERQPKKPPKNKTKSPVAAVYDRRTEEKDPTLTHRRYKRSVGATFSSSRFLRYNRRRLNPVLTQTQPAIKHSERGLARLILGAAIAGMLWLVLCRHLSGDWSINEQYSYGWFVPFFSVYLFWLRWEDRPLAEIQNSKLEIQNGRTRGMAIGIIALLLLLPLRVFEIGNPDWRPLSWTHAFIVVTISL